MIVCSKLYQKVPFLQYLKRKNVIFNLQPVLYIQLNSSLYSSNYAKAIIKDKVVFSPFSNVPVDISNNLNSFLWKNTKWMDRTAVVCGVTGASHTFEELKKLSDAFGNALLQQGFKQGQVIAVILQNVIETPVVLLGAVAAGLPVCSINPLYTSDEMKHQLLNSNAEGIVTSLNLLPTVEEAISKLDKPLKVFVTPGIKDEDKNVNIKSNTSDIIFYEQVIKDNIKNKALKPNTKSQDLFHISHSSGTTGLPKGIWLSHGNFVNNVLQSTSIDCLALQTVTTEDHQDVVPVVLPLFHNFALNILIKCLYLRSKVVLLPKFDGNLYLNALEKYQATVLYTVPPIMQYLLSSSKLNSNHTKDLKNILCAGAPLNVPDVDELVNKVFPPTMNFREAYGLTEATCFLTMNTVESNKYQSVGIPIPNTQLKVIDVQDGNDKDAKEEGEICFKGPQMAKCYINNLKATEESIDKDGWFHTGDIGYYDDQGYFFIVDRLKDMIKVKGFQVSPSELEELLKTHELVTDAAVLGIPHPRKGEAPVAFITTNCDHNKEHLKQLLLEYVKGKAAAFKQLENIIILDKIPKTLSGKILRKDLRNLLKS